MSIIISPQSTMFSTDIPALAADTVSEEVSSVTSPHGVTTVPCLLSPHDTRRSMADNSNGEREMMFLGISVILLIRVLVHWLSKSNTKVGFFLQIKAEKSNFAFRRNQKQYVMIRIAVQSKGRLSDDTMNLLAESDVKINAKRRTLLVQSANFPVEILYLRDDDIPESVATGVADVGIVGENEYEERGGGAEIVTKLGFSKCRLSLAIPKAADYNGLQWFNGRKIATSYPNILRRFLDENEIDAEIHVIMGSVEISPGIGLSDAIFDIVSSGSTLVSNNLREVETVMRSEALLIANKSLSAEKREILNQLMFRFEAVINAADKKYVRMNAPKESLKDIIDVLPGLKSPTIIPLADEEWCSIHAVLDEKRFWEIIGKLKELGAQGILVTPIEKMIL